jgi:hypothetical protein
VRPTKLRILGKTYSVKYTTEYPVNDDTEGHCDYLTLKITIRKDLAPAEERSTLLHEALHCVSHAMGLHLEENAIERLESGVFALLVDNPAFLDYIKKKVPA